MSLLLSIHVDSAILNQEIVWGWGVWDEVKLERDIQDLIKSLLKFILGGWLVEKGYLLGILQLLK